MTAWRFDGEELPFGGERTWWVDAHGLLSDMPVADAEPLPGAFVLSGLVDSHAHPAIGKDFTAQQRAEVVDQLREWCAAGILFVRDVGSPGSVTLHLGDDDRLPTVQAAGRFLAPPHHYFPTLYEPVDEDDLLGAALAEVEAGASWIKIIADFPDLDAGTPPEPTYTIDAIATVTAAAHQAGARVAAHSTIDNIAQLVAAGVDSIEHGVVMTDEALELMATRKVGWTPTITAADALLTDELTPEQRRRFADADARLREFLPRAVRLGIPVLAGSDVVGSIAGEVARLADFGLEPAEALAAASTTAHNFLNHPQHTGSPANLVTYDADPRNDPAILNHPAAVIARGHRIT